MMKSISLLVSSIVMLGVTLYAQSGSLALQNDVGIEPYREHQLHEQYIAFLKTLNPEKIEADYAGAVRRIRSRNSQEQLEGLAVFGATAEIDALALIVPLLDSEDDSVRVGAGSALEHIVSGNELRRRDPKHGEKIILLPRAPGDTDLRPLAWVILKMMRAEEDGCSAAYAATMAGYLRLSEFTGELKKLLNSRHPAVQNSAAYALSLLKDNSIDN